MNSRRSFVLGFNLRFLALLFVLLVSLHSSQPIAQAGSYGAQLFSFGNGAVPGISNWNESVTLSSRTLGLTNSPIPIASVQGSALRLTADGYFGTLAAFKLIDLDPLQDISSFTASFLLRMSATNTPGRGVSLSFGNIPDDDGDGELGFSIPGGFVISWDTTVDPAAGKTEGEIAVHVNRTKIASYPQTFTFDSVLKPVAVKWDAQGLEVSYAGAVIFSKLPLTGFVPRIGDRFAFSARTGETGAQETAIDTLLVKTVATASIPTGGPIISEFVANNTSFEDDDVVTSDWLELYNGGLSQSMTGWYLTNEKTNKTKWPFPNFIFATNQYRLIFASGKNRSSTNTQLHANFTLSKQGGYLALIRPDLTIASEYEYGPQTQNIALGEVGSARTVGFLEIPTPGRKNVTLIGSGPPAEAVRLSQPGGLLTSTQPLELRIEPPIGSNAVVRYTLNNTLPTATSPLYEAPFQITNTVTIRARVFMGTQLPGPVKTCTFLRVDSSLSNFANTGKPFNSPISILVMDSFGVDVDGGDRNFRLNYAVALEPDSETGRATLTGIPDFQGRCGIHVRGESSGGFGQKSYAVEIWNEYNTDRDDTLLGLPAESDWVLYGPWSEKSLMRNHLIYQTMQELRSDYSGPRTRFVEVFLNEGRNQPVSYSDYKGVYLLVEKIKHSKNRLDIGKLNPMVTDTNLLSGGYVFKSDKSSTGVTAWSTKGGIGLQSHDPEALTLPMQKSLKGYLDGFEAALNGPTFSDPIAGYAAWIDVGSFVDAQLYVEIAKQVDGYVFSTYFNKPRGEKIHAGPTWDFNIALGNADYGTGDNPRGWLYAGSDADPLAGGLWYGRLQQDPSHKLRFFDRYWELRRGLWGNSNILSRIDSIANLLLDGNSQLISNSMPITVQSPVARQYRKHAILGVYYWPNPPGVEQRRTFQSEIAQLKKWLSDRLAWMDDQYLNGVSIFRPPTLGHPGGTVPVGYQLTMDPYAGTAPVGKTYGTGKVYYTTDGSDPRPTGYPVPTRQEPVFIPEYSQATYFVPTADNGGADLTIADWTSPTLGPTGSSLTWVNGKLGFGFDDVTAPTYKHIGGGTAAQGDIRNAMLNRSSTVYIRIPFTVTEAQLSQMVDLGLKMRFDDGFIAYLNGNEVARVHIKSNTAVAYTMVADAIASGFSDTSSALQRDINLGRYISTLKPGENLLGILGVNSNKLDADALFSPRLAAVLSVPPNTAITSTLYTQPLAITGTTQLRARLYANGIWSPIVNATYVVDAVPASAENLVLSEFMYNPPAPTAAEGLVAPSASDYEWLEFMNSSTSAVDLSGVRITNGVRFDFNSGASSALRLPAGERVVVYANSPAFQKRYGTNPMVRLTGPFADNLSNGGEAVTVVGRDGKIILNFTYGDKAPWPEEADGLGYSLVLNNPSAHPAVDPNLPWNWHSSPVKNGSPGLDNSASFTLPPFEDADGDGLANLFEFATGSDPRDPSSRSTLKAGLREFSVLGIKARYYYFEFRRSLVAENVSYGVETSNDLVAWNPRGGALTLVGSANNLDGTATMTYRSTQPADQFTGQALFARLVVQ